MSSFNKRTAKHKDSKITLKHHRRHRDLSSQLEEQSQGGETLPTDLKTSKLRR